MLPYSIGSVLQQDFSDFEVLVVGDGCTDDSEAVVNSIGDDRVRWINLPVNAGHQFAANNEGLRQARGELIAYLGHDDVWFPHHLSSLTTRVAEGYDLVYDLTALVLADGVMQGKPSSGSYFRGMWIPPSSVVHRRVIIERLGDWRNYRELNEDPEVDLWRRAFDSDFRFSFVPRLGVVKLAASARKDCYKNRPCHEQMEFSLRMKNEPDLEKELLTKMLLVELDRTMLYEGSLGKLVKYTFNRSKNRLLSYFKAPATNGEAVARRRKFKGLTG